MPDSYTGSAAGITPRQDVTIADPLDGEDATGAGNATPDKTLADILQWVQKYMAGLSIPSLGITTPNLGILDLTGIAAAPTLPAARSTDTPAVRKFLFGFNLNGFARTVRFYAEGAGGHNGPGLLITVNAAWDFSGHWNQDQSSVVAMAFFLGQTFAVYQQALGDFPATEAVFFGGGTGGALVLDFLDSSIVSGIKAGQALGAYADGIIGQVGPGITHGFCHEAFHLVQPFGAGAPAFTSGWSNSTTGHRKACFWRDTHGTVHLEGNATGPNTSIIFTLPVGYRPLGPMTFLPQSSISGTFLGINANGDVYVTGSAGTLLVDMTGICFNAEVPIV